MEQTAVNWLIEQLSKTDQRSLGDLLKIHKQAQEMERKQIEEAVHYGQNNHSVSITLDKHIASDYFPKKYTNGKESN